VRLLEKFPHGDPPSAGEFASCHEWVTAFLREQVRPELEAALHSAAMPAPLVLVGTGGTASLLSRLELKLSHFDRAAIENISLSQGQIRAARELLWSLPLAQRQELPGLPKTRADVILTGAAIYEAVMEVFGIEQLSVSTRGLRFAAVMKQGS
jgi:exopolyphosphatase/guanosine-5'-triphosphate,3'-diphosphate pyrophosphatase